MGEENRRKENIGRKRSNGRKWKQKERVVRFCWYPVNLLSTQTIFEQLVLGSSHTAVGFVPTFPRCILCEFIRYSFLCSFVADTRRFLLI
jgi:hypothetical protein